MEVEDHCQGDGADEDDVFEESAVMVVHALRSSGSDGKSRIVGERDIAHEGDRRWGREGGEGFL